MLNFMKRTWWGWKGMVHGINAGISVTLMAIAYWVGMGPVALGFHLFRPDPVDRGLGDPDAETDWQEPRMGRQDVRRSQRPW